LQVNDIENELVNFIEKDMKCALVGDFNAKTAVLEDFSEPDETFLNVIYIFLKVFVQYYLVCIHTEYIFLKKYYYQVKLGSHSNMISK
jgi:hypothetical protein